MANNLSWTKAKQEDSLCKVVILCWAKTCSTNWKGLWQVSNNTGITVSTYKILEVRLSPTLSFSHKEAFTNNFCLVKRIAPICSLISHQSCSMLQRSVNIRVMVEEHWTTQQVQQEMLESLALLKAVLKMQIWGSHRIKKTCLMANKISFWTQAHLW